MPEQTPISSMAAQALVLSQTETHLMHIFDAMYFGEDTLPEPINPNAGTIREYWVQYNEARDRVLRQFVRTTSPSGVVEVTCREG